MPVLVAGPAAELIDARESVAARLPIAVAVIVVATAILLFALTGSVVVPVKALCMNVLTLLATLGVLVAVFEWGWGSSLLGFEPWGALDLTTPLLLFVFIFGLSMDYEVFLLARIKEEWDRRTGDDRAANDRAVLRGYHGHRPGRHHRRARDRHRLPRLRARRAGRGQGDRRRHDGGRAAGRHRGARPAAALRHVAARRRELVAPGAQDQRLTGA